MMLSSLFILFTPRITNGVQMSGQSPILPALRRAHLVNEIRETRGEMTGAGRRFGIVASRFNSRLGDLLVAGAVDCLRRHGVAAADIHLVSVPGAWEIPQALEELVTAGGDSRVDGLVAIGVVIRGETPHFDYLC